MEVICKNINCKQCFQTYKKNRKYCSQKCSYSCQERVSLSKQNKSQFWETEKGKELKDKLAAKRIGKVQSEETKAKRSVSLKGKLKGRKFSTGTIDKMRAASNHLSYVDKLVLKGFSLEEALLKQGENVEKSKATKRLKMNIKGGKSKYYETVVGQVQGTYELDFINQLVKNNLELPKKPNGIITPYGDSYPDFEFEDYFVEIKSSWTYKVLIGEVKGLSDKKDHQLEKFQWIHNNVKPVIIRIGTKNYKTIAWEDKSLSDIVGSVITAG